LENLLNEKKDMLKTQVNMIEASKQLPNWKASIFTHENDVDEDIVCDVCRDAEYDEADPSAPYGSDERIGDAIVICDNCNAGVHQKCYGRELINPNGLPEGDWFCNRC
jgi:PHD-finger